jgi:hypothetical protein
MNLGYNPLEISVKTGVYKKCVDAKIKSMYFFLGFTFGDSANLILLLELKGLDFLVSVI